jgi:hypothetical protein
MESSVESIQSRIAGEPIIAIVSLRDQRIIVCDATGWILRAPVSSGQKGRETYVCRDLVETWANRLARHRAVCRCAARYQRMAAILVYRL